MNSFKNLLKHKYFIGRYPEIDWPRLLTLFIVIGFFMGCWSVYTFYEIKTEVFMLDGGTDNSSFQTNTQQKELDEVISRYQAKEKKFEQLQKGSAFSAVSTSTSAAATSTAISTTRATSGKN